VCSSCCSSSPASRWPARPRFIGVNIGLPSLDGAASAGANLFDMLTPGGRLADLRPTPSAIVDEGPQRTVRRFLTAGGHEPSGEPVLLVPPLAAPATCFDLRRGCSLVEHLAASGHRAYVVDYGPIGFGDRDLGLEHWIRDVLPPAIHAVSEDAGEEVAVVGWCLGGIMALLTLADDPSLPVDAVGLVASPFDFTRVRLMAPMRPVANLTGGAVGTFFYRLMGGVPTPLVRTGFQLSSLDKYLTKPWAIATHVHDRDYLAQMQAVDEFTANMLAYPGRTFGQIYHRFFRVNDLADGHLELSDHEIDLNAVEVPVLVVAGESDTLAPRAAVHHLAQLLPNAPDVELRTAPGGHLGVLAGRSARGTTWRYVDDFLAAHDRGHDVRAEDLRVKKRAARLG
jgi:polyhydroxyalkanoate synthase subunit PhaC